MSATHLRLKRGSRIPPNDWPGMPPSACPCIESAGWNRRSQFDRDSPSIDDDFPFEAEQCQPSGRIYRCSE